MSDSTLESCQLLTRDKTKITIEPKFKTKNLTYSALLPSDIESLQFDCFTFDENASYKILDSGTASNDQREFVNFDPNEKKTLKIVVENCSGTNKSEYIFEITRLSASSAFLSDVAFQTEKKKSFRKNAVSLKPEFSPNVTDYDILLENFSLKSLFVRTKFPDSNTKCSINDGDSINLEPAITNFKLTLTSPNGQTTKNYHFTISRQGPKIFIPPTSDKITCQLTKSLAFPPILINGKIFNQTFFEMMTRMNRVDPFIDENDEEANFYLYDDDINKIPSQKLPDQWHTPTEQALKTLSENSNFEDILTFLNEKFKPEEVNLNAQKKQILETDWAKAILQDGFQIPKIVNMLTEKSKISFIDKLARNAHPQDNIETLKSEQKIDYNRIACLAAKQKNYIQLGLALELSYINEWLGQTEQKQNQSRHETGKKIKQSGWEDDIKCVCELHGFPKTANLQQQLQALDKELQALKGSNADNNKQDHVRELYEYKQRQAVDRAERKGLVCDKENEAFTSYLMSILGNDGGKWENLYYAGRACFKMGEIECGEYLLQNCLIKNSNCKEAQMYLSIINDKKYPYKQQSIQIWEKFQLFPIFNIKNEIFHSNYGVFQSDTNLYLTDIWKCYESNDPKLLHLLWTFLSSLKTTSNAYQKTIWEILKVSKNAKFSNCCLKILSNSFKFNDHGRVARFNLDIKKEKLINEPRNVNFLILFGKLSFEIASDEDDLGEISKYLNYAIEAFQNAIKFENCPVDGSEKPNFDFLKIEKNVVTTNMESKSSSKNSRTNSKTTAKAPVKGPTKSVPKGKSNQVTRTPVNNKSTKKVEAVDPKPEKPAKCSKINTKRPISRLYLAKCYNLKYEYNDGDQISKENAIKYYKLALDLLNDNIECIIDLARLLRNEDSMGAVDLYTKIITISENTKIPQETISFVASEIVNILLKEKQLDDPRLEQNMIIWAKHFGLAMLDKATKILEDVGKTKILKRVYCTVHGKPENDSDMIQFFHFKCW